MSATKFTGGTIAALAVLGASLVANAYLWSRPAAVGGAATSAPEAGALVVEAPAVTLTDLVKRADLAVLRDRLRAVGASDAAVRAALEGILRRRYREQLSSDRAARMQRGWWRNQQRTEGTPQDPQRPFDDPRLMREMVTAPLERLLGPDPLDLAEADVKYAFLPEETRRALAKLDGEMVAGWTPSGIPEEDAKLRAEYFAQRQNIEDRRKALMATFTLEQRADYEMRFGTFATNLGRQLDLIGVTEQEFRTVFLLADAAKQELAAREAQGEASVGQSELVRQMADKLVAALGRERALDVMWSGTSDYAALARVAREANLPESTAGRAVQLAAEAGDRAAAIHADGAMTVGQKRAALLALQATVQPQLEALYPGGLRQRIAPNALLWFTELGQGRYKPVAASLPGQGAIVMTFSATVSDPAPATRPTPVFNPQWRTGN